MRQVLLLILVIAVWAVSRLPVDSIIHEESVVDAEALTALGFTVLAGYLCGVLLKRFGLPKVTGYMLLGIAVGPHLFGILSIRVQDSIDLIQDIALVLIALTAGGELRMSDLRLHWKKVLAVLLGQTVAIFLISLAALLFLADVILPGVEMRMQRLLVVALLLGIMTTANSPSVAVAVVTELRARGSLTNLVMAVTVAKDMFVIVLFTIGLALARSVMGGHASTASAHLPLAALIAGSILLGAAIGGLLILYMRFINRQIEIALLVLAVVLIRLIQFADLELLLTAITIGFIVENFSSQGENLISGLERISEPIYVVFFALSGAMVNLPLLIEIGLVAVLWTVIRAAGMWGGTLAGLSVIGAIDWKDKLAWKGYLPQAGVAIGLTAILAANYPVWGKPLQTLVLSVVAINQIIGPVAFRSALVRAKETGDQL